MDLKMVMLDKKTYQQKITKENERLMMEKNEVKDEVVEVARIAERETVMKVKYLTELADKSIRKVPRLTEQLDLAQAANA